ncbi:aminotransferase class I/II-fold pyridoxal phosphate-dependent enzyme [Peribacillus asahii]|uniref:aminotransferase class I/II-fold pyridoxal phosphate-dependent enzyme n=1 Tax=Peribacillus asahii TaxID=228899 RepID=UPI00207AD58D|nr:aminotransferase class I/II-fold pyridoxal phosphate-dependent enzyme [Peribacillus asahii]USK59903.1 aminotransferase class I/II-fold pyridoxal phosphate-dependent enzyme [Peribacillus asahii]
MNQLQTPLFSALAAFHKENKVSYHVPGHKNGQIFMNQGRRMYESLLQIDATELSGLDDLHAPEGPIKEAGQLLANLYGVQNSYFLVNGSTVGNIAMIMGTCEEGDTVLVQRNCHKSILHGLMLANVKPVFLQPMIYKEWEVAGGLDVQLITEALNLHPETKAIILTSPNYYGLSQELSSIITVAHDKGIPVLVDEAHGAHFSADNRFPQSAIEAGADVVVHSAHKTLPAMTMGSYLHVNTTLVNKERIEWYLQMLQSSSPSYPIMGSLDLARAYLAAFTEDDCQFLIKRIADFKDQLSAIKEIEVLEPPKGVTADPLKVSIRSTQGLSGYEVQALLEEAGIYSELADPRNVLFVLPLLKKEQFYPLRQTIEQIQGALKGKTGQNSTSSMIQWKEEAIITTLVISYSDMKQMKTKQVLLNEAIGQVSAEMVIPYPPGIPFIMPGEMITAEKVATLKHLLAHKSRFHGGQALTSGELIVYESGSVR